MAKPETGAHDQQMRQMLQTLLSDRFQLQFHRETRQGAAYGLYVGKRGAKLRPAKESANSGITSGRNRDTGLSTLSGDRVTLEEIAANLAARLGRPVFDKTGLAGKFDFELTWAPDLTLSRGADSASPVLSGPPWSPLFKNNSGFGCNQRKARSKSS
jgi:uncharacterized protein (TIGR03435 family)